MVLSGQQKGALSKNTHIFISYSLPLCALTLLFTNISRAVGPLRRLIYQPFTLYKILKFLSETSKESLIWLMGGPFSEMLHRINDALLMIKIKCTINFWRTEIKCINISRPSFRVKMQKNPKRLVQTNRILLSRPY